MITAQSRLTTVIPYKFRPEDNWRFKIAFVDELNAPYDMDSADLILSVHAAPISRTLVASDGTNDLERIICERKIINLSEPLENGIYLIDQPNQVFRITYGQKKGQTFVTGSYFATLYQVTEDGEQCALVSFDILVTNQIEDTGSTVINIDKLVLPIQKINNAIISVTIKL